jgi:hypothetical protein
MAMAAGAEKRLRVQATGERLSAARGAATAPGGIVPVGAAPSLAWAAAARRRGLGAWAHVRDDADVVVIVRLLRLGPRDLLALAACSPWMHAVATQEELWRDMVLARWPRCPPGFAGGSWRSTYARAAASAPGSVSGSASASVRRAVVNGDVDDGDDDDDHGHQGVCDRPLVFSDALYRPWLTFVAGLAPQWLAVNSIPRRAALSVDEFITSHERPNTPVIIVDGAAHWPALRKWSRDFLCAAAGEQTFSVGPTRMSMQDYWTYASTTRDEMPLYLFDKKFVASVPALSDDYAVPPYFAEDLFSVLGDDRRPDYRWLIIGPERSGSTFHIDPNGTR